MKSVTNHSNQSEFLWTDPAKENWKCLGCFGLSLFTQYSYSLHFPIKQACYFVNFVYNGVKSANKAKWSISQVQTIDINNIRPLVKCIHNTPFLSLPPKTFTMNQWVPLPSHSFLWIVILKTNFTPPYFNTSFLVCCVVHDSHTYLCRGSSFVLLWRFTQLPQPRYLITMLQCPGSGVGCLLQVNAASPWYCMLGHQLLVVPDLAVSWDMWHGILGGCGDKQEGQRKTNRKKNGEKTFFYFMGRGWMQGGWVI